MAGIYIHIPFCRQACHYCDFHFSTSSKNREEMIDAIKKELSLRKEYLSGELVETVYFGGGTPSLIDSELLKMLLETIQQEFNLDLMPEITLEANPDDLSDEKLRQLFSIGINRLSIGIQSFHDNDLRFMNRAHDSFQASTVVSKARNAGFENLSIDLIYGLPDSTDERWIMNIEKALELNVEHLSCYSLTVEPRTALADMIRKKKVAALDEERSAADLEVLIKRTRNAGYEHYEISNFARDKKYSRHNTSYWQAKKYLGVGPSAHSYDGASRQWNISNNIAYISSLKENVVMFEKEFLSTKNKFNEFILISLRTMWGIDYALLEDIFGKTKRMELDKMLEPQMKAGMVELSGNNIILTHKGKFFADRIAADLFI